MALVLPSFEQVLADLAAAEDAEGWLARCEEREQFLVLTRELVNAVGALLQPFSGLGPMLEVCAGAGELANALRAAGVSMIATDMAPLLGAHVVALPAADALRAYEPAVVLGAFVPFNAGVDEAVLACGAVRHYLVLNARIGGQLGSEALWRTAGWTPQALPDVSRWMLTRHDVWVGGEREVLQHGEAWLLSRD